MKQKKLVMMGGFATSEASDMRKLKKLAQKGWRLTGSKYLCYQLEKSEPEDLDFATDYLDEPDEEYFLAFEKAGWKHALSVAHVHIFSAPAGTTPIYTDRSSEIQKLQNQEKFFKKPAFVFSLLLVMAFVIEFYLIPSTGWLNFVWTMVITALIIATVFTMLPYVAYKIRRRRLEKQS